MVYSDDAFTRMVDETLASVSRYALRRASTAADAEDVVAETYAVAWRRRQHVPTGPDALPWLYGVARRVLANQRRGGRRWEHLRAKVAGQRPGSVSPDVDAIVQRQPVLDALNRLPAKDAELLRLLVWEQLTQAEAAMVMGTSENAVALRASRARQKLAQILDDSAAGTIADDRSGAVADMDGRATPRRNDGV